MSQESQPDAIHQIEHALVALRAGERRNHGPRGSGGPGGAGGAAGAGDAPWGDRRPPWGDGPPPWAAGHHAHSPLAGAARFRLLEALERAGAETQLSISEVAALIGVDQPRASRLVNDAAERGLVLRSADRRDARRSVIELAEPGRALLQSARASRHRAVTEALAGFSQEETKTLATLLARFAAAWPARPPRP